MLLGAGRRTVVMAKKELEQEEDEDPLDEVGLSMRSEHNLSISSESRPAQD